MREGPDDLTVIERMLDSLDLLRRLVPLARDNHDVARGGVREREEDRLASVGLYADEPGTSRSAVDACDDRVDDRRGVFAPGS